MLTLVLWIEVRRCTLPCANVVSYPLLPFLSISLSGPGKPPNQTPHSLLPLDSRNPPNLPPTSAAASKLTPSEPNTPLSTINSFLRCVYSLCLASVIWNHLCKCVAWNLCACAGWQPRTSRIVLPQCSWATLDGNRVMDQKAGSKRSNCPVNCLVLECRGNDVSFAKFCRHFHDRRLKVVDPLLQRSSAVVGNI